MRSAGLSRLTYRLRTELGVQAWHWNPRGRWSDAAHARGYWISDSTSRTPIVITHGYRLPRRGDTIDQADNDDYSRLDDGDTATFWKSNPYLDPALDRDDTSPHPQWVLVDLGSVAPVSAIRILWAAPYATDFRVQYWIGSSVLVEMNPIGYWVTFPRGEMRASTGGDQRISLADAPIGTRFVRLVLSAGSHTALAGDVGANATGETIDARDSAGYAIRELWIGTRAGDSIVDVLHHGLTRTAQSITYTSSTDPWHRASDIDSTLEQPGFDRVATSGLTNHLPMMVPVPILFSTPEDGANELRFLRARGYAVDRVELGEEPDGQYVTPEDFASLYLRWATALRAVSPRVTLGGPSFQSPENQVMMPGPGDSAGALWNARFLDVLRARHRLADFAFLSFEWYPFDDVCDSTGPQLASAPSRLSNALRNLRAQGVPDTMPIVISEFGYSAFAAQAEVDMAGALYEADLVGHFLSLGGATAFLYGYEPTSLDHDPDCPSGYGNNALFLATTPPHAPSPVATYHAMRLLTHEWIEPGDRVHVMHPAVAMADGEADTLLSAYAVHRPDHRWAVLLVNRDEAHSRTVRLSFGSSAGLPRSSHDEWLFSSQQYRWHPNGLAGRASPNLPPAHRATRDSLLVMPPYSIAVVRSRR